MAKIFNPFLENEELKENRYTEVNYIHINRLYMTNEQKQFFRFLSSYKEAETTHPKAFEECKALLINLIGTKAYQCIKECYLDTYSMETKKFDQYAPIEDIREAVVILRVAKAVFNALPQLRYAYKRGLLQEGAITNAGTENT